MVTTCVCYVHLIMLAIYERLRLRKHSKLVKYVDWVILLSVVLVFRYFFFFFQAEDGIRDKLVTGVQTCALPISCHRASSVRNIRGRPQLYKGCFHLKRTPLRQSRPRCPLTSSAPHQKVAWNCG